MFSFSTIENFDEHIDKSIFGYSSLNESIIKMSDYFIDKDTNVYDIGCSTGALLLKLKDRQPLANYYGIEKEANIIKHREGIELMHLDVREINIFNNASFITSVFTLQFIDKKDRFDIIKKIYNGLNSGGAFVIAEKVISESAKIQDIFTFQYYDFKAKNFTSDEILSKERDLRKIMKPTSYLDNENMLKKAGFRTFDIFWKSFNFTAIIAIKD